MIGHPLQMDPERWHKINELFHAALETPAGERDLFLDDTCAGDNELREEVESLLASHKQAAAFIAGAALKATPNTAPAAAQDSEAGKAVVNMRFDAQLLTRVDAAAKQQGISRTAWLHVAASKALER